MRLLCLFGAVTMLGGIVGGCSGDDDPAIFDPEITEINIRPAARIVAAGRRIQLVAEAKTADGSSYDQNTVVTWEVSDTAILTVNEVGIAQGIAEGTATVTATHPDGPSATADVQVLAGDVVSVRIDPGNQTLVAGDTLQLTATAVLQDETEQDVTADANWACNNLAAATVNNEAEKGLLTGVEAGTATVAATFLGVRGGTPITITPADAGGEDL